MTYGLRHFVLPHCEDDPGERWRIAVGAAIMVMALTVALAVPRPALGQSKDGPRRGQTVQGKDQTPRRGQSVQERQQERQQSEDYAPIGARVGSFQFFPAIDVDVEFGSNIFAVQNGDQSDTLTRIRPEMALNSDWNQHALNFNVSSEIVRYYRFDDDDVENYNVGADGVVDILRNLQVTWGSAYSLDHEDRGDPDASGTAREPTEYASLDYDVNVEYKPSKFSSKLAAIFVDRDYDDDTNIDGSRTNNDDRDRDGYEIGGRFGYEYLPDTEAFVGATYNNADYDSSFDDNGENRDSDGYSVIVGTGLDFTGLVTGEVYVGYLEQTYDDPNLKKLSDFNAGASVQWDATPLITVNGLLSRTVQETTQAGSSGFLSTFMSLTADYEILRQLTANANFSFTNDDYATIRQDDDTYEIGIGAKYLFNRNLVASLGYNYKDKDSNVDGSSYQQHTALLTVRGQF